MNYKIIDGKVYYIKESVSMNKILSILKNDKQLNIKQISTKIGIAYNNTHSLLQKLSNLGLVGIKREPNTQNNPSIVILKRNIEDD
ncbi:MAG: winged helix-turn-helix transcriptional regulator [Nanoarchaeota archaeon]